MKIRNITKPNKKGQIVIPKDLRDSLGIEPGQILSVEKRGRGVYITPVEDFIKFSDTDDSYLNILEKTRGSWASEDWESVREQREKVEKQASKERKEEW